MTDDASDDGARESGGDRTDPHHGDGTGADADAGGTGADADAGPDAGDDAGVDGDDAGVDAGEEVDPGSAHRREPPGTDEGWFVLHDLRTVDWDAWRSLPERERRLALTEGRAHLRSALAVEDDGDGMSLLFTVLGHGADLLVVHMRPSLDALNRLERAFERTALAGVTERADSFVSVTEASGYSVPEYFAEEDVEVDPGLERYIQSRLTPAEPDADYVCFYPMNKRRGPEYNWYDLPFEERAEHMRSHGEIGKGYAGQVRQVITSAVALDDWEWGVTLFGDDPTAFKDLLYEMRFDASTSRYAEFGEFYVGRRIDPADLPAFFAGETVPADAPDGTAARPEVGTGAGTATPGAGVPEAVGGDGTARADRPGVDAGGAAGPGTADAAAGRDGADAGTDAGAAGGPGGPPPFVDAGDADGAGAGPPPGVVPDGAVGASDAESGRPGGGTGPATPTGADADTDADGPLGDDDIRGELSDMGVYAGQPHGEDVYAVVVYSEADSEDLFDEVRGLRANFDHYGTHRRTAVYEATGVEAGDGEDVEGAVVAGDGAEGDGEGAGLKAVASVWETRSAADTAGGFLSDLPGVVRQAGDDADDDTWGTMGMFYRVEPDYREEFLGKFEDVGGTLAGMDGHLHTSLLANREDDADLFIASRWDSREDAAEFFRSKSFRDTVDWGREVLADRPRHVFLA